MTRSALAAAAVGLAVWTGLAAAALPARVTVDGIAGVVPGQSPEEVGRRWAVPIPDNVFAPGCQAVPVLAGAMRGYALFEEGSFGSVFFDRGAVTGRGVRIGSTLTALKRAYGSRLTSRPNKYTPGARDYFFRRARTPRWELRFDVSKGGRVKTIAFGNETVRYVEGCA
ncbi:MAG: hypothetical protein ACRDQ2_00595 [Gaiellales bacterium]